MADRELGLAEAIESVRAELRAAQDVGVGADVRFAVGSVEVEFVDKQRWECPVERSPRLAGLSERSMICEAVGFPDAQLRPDRLRDTERAPGRLLPGGGARDPEGLIPFDVDTSV